ncbi:MAG: 50S ribosomal protein L29 [Chloroflexi bacterium]|jgi:large subunit ribosomal protein L29|nr:50S ribosomal protein L29 [Chloroflexota bacterium]MBT7081936.1 50S ribosomal protein L29 [Chloroflexota bacterium]MBT7290506.1 50S ribosomal protein L29 [Chloroflexota bacterium]
MKPKDIRKLKPEALIKQYEESHHELFNLRFQVATGQLSNHNELNKVKKTIARIKTIIRERELAQDQE